jgi:hypothetical protein
VSWKKPQTGSISSSRSPRASWRRSSAPTPPRPSPASRPCWRSTGRRGSSRSGGHQVHSSELRDGPQLGPADHESDDHPCRRQGMLLASWLGPCKQALGAVGHPYTPRCSMRAATSLSRAVCSFATRNSRLSTRLGVPAVHSFSPGGCTCVATGPMATTRTDLRSSSAAHSPPEPRRSPRNQGAGRWCRCGAWEVVFKG